MTFTFTKVTAFAEMVPLLRKDLRREGWFMALVVVALATMNLRRVNVTSNALFIGQLIGVILMGIGAYFLGRWVKQASLQARFKRRRLLVGPGTITLSGTDLTVQTATASQVLHPDQVRHIELLDGLVYLHLTQKKDVVLLRPNQTAGEWRAMLELLASDWGMKAKLPAGAA